MSHQAALHRRSVRSSETQLCVVQRPQDAAPRRALSICFLNLSLEHVARLGNLFRISE